MHTNSTDSTHRADSKSRARGRKAASEATLHLKGLRRESQAESQVESQVMPTREYDSNNVVDMIATAAYYLAEQRRFEPGHELEDWLVAEQRIRALNS